MKSTIKNIALATATMFVLASCNNEELFVDEVAVDEVETEEFVETEEIKEDIEEIPIDPTLPCDFELSNATANSTIIINCILDLDGQTVTLPNNVYLSYEGGDIINGTINFGANNTIDGELLNYSLSVAGSTPKLNDPIFEFLPERWDIVEGVTTSDLALKNNLTIEDVMFQVKAYGASTMKIDEINAYIEGARITPPNYINFYPQKEAINIPSDFNLIMTENTHFWVQPATSETKELANGAIFAVDQQSNITVTGGYLHGDRDTRYYSPDNDGLEGAHLFYIQSGTNVTLDGITFLDGSKGGLAISSIGFTYNSYYNPTKHVNVLNCVFKNIRRMSVALTDGRNILFEGNQFIDTGLPTANSTGGEVGYAVNMEATRVRDENGILVEREKVTDIVFRKNIESGSRGGSVSIHIAQNVTVEDNDLDRVVSYTFTNGTKIINNRFTSKITHEGYAVFAVGKGETVYNNEISGNIIKNYNLGIIINSNDFEVNNNDISDTDIGIVVGQSINGKVNSNIIDADLKGISMSNSYVDNVEITNNEIYSNGFLMDIKNLNNDEEYAEYAVNVSNNVFTNSQKVSIENSNGINFINNKVNGGLQIGNVTNTVISNNVIIPTDFDGIRLYNNHDNVSLIDNTIYEPTGASRYLCINNGSESQDEIVEKGNTCN